MGRSRSGRGKSIESPTKARSAGPKAPLSNVSAKARARFLRAPSVELLQASAPVCFVSVVRVSAECSAAAESLARGEPLVQAESMGPMPVARVVEPVAEPLPPVTLTTARRASWVPPVLPVAEPTPSLTEEDETPRSIPAVVVSCDDEPAPESVSPVQLVARPPALTHHFATRARIVLTLAAAAVVGMFVHDRGEVMRMVSRLSFAKPSLAAANVAGALTAKKAEPKPAPVVEPPACPPEMALVTRDEIRVCVDKWEASLVEVIAGEDVPWSPYVAIDGLASSGRTMKAVSKPGVVPQGYIDRDAAAVACEVAGKRLCAASEWTAACEGPRRTTYPYGNDANEKACNTHGRSPLGELFGASFKDHLYDNKVMNDPSLNALEGTVAKTGAFDQCTNGFGVYDMVGNLHEWTAEKKGVFHGGYYQDATQNGPGCRYATSAHFSSYHDYSTGFRCCKDAE